MDITSKQIYVSIQIGSNEVKILVSEYFNTRFNIIHCERLESNAINDFKVVDKDQLVKDIKKIVESCSNKIGASVQEAILLIPAYNFKRFAMKSTVFTDKGYLTKEDVARAVNNSLRTKVDNDVLIVNSLVTRYTINGISTRRFPEKEACEECVVDLDLLCADKEVTYNYVDAVEKAGIKVLDIALNSYAVCKEAALLDESLKKNIILLDINCECTYLSLLSKGKLISTEVVFDGLNSIVDATFKKYHIPKKDIKKIVKYNVNYNTEFKDDIVYAYSESGQSNTISANDLNECIEKPLDALVDKYVTLCRPILEQGAELVLTGEGKQMQMLVDKLEEKMGCKIKTYYPDTIGVRDPSLTALYGSCFVFREKALMNNISVNCIDMIAYDSHIEHKEFDSEGETITTKIKNLFKQYIDGGQNNDN